jgi:hypothetical protein
LNIVIELFRLLDLNGDVSGVFHINMAMQGSFDTGVINLFKTGLPGLSIPG